MFLCIWAATASAGDLEVWSREDFGTPGALAGSDGWQGGFGDDAWRSDTARAYSESDVTNSDTSGTTYGSGWAADNWLIRGVDIHQGGIEAEFQSEDDDTMGLVFAHDGVDSFYLAGFSEDLVPPPVPSPADGPTVFLVKVEGGIGSVVAVEPFAPAAGGGLHSLRIERDDDRVWVSIDGVLLIQATDPAPLPAGRAGLYAYASGEDFPTFFWDEDSPAWFERVLAFATDEDGDGVADDLDNCETLPNTDQLDLDADGIGDVCDDAVTEPTTEPTPGTTPSGTDTGEVAPVDDTAAPGTEPGADPEEDVQVTGCGCATDSAALPWALTRWAARRSR